MAKPKFAYLLLKEHPYGREMLRQILSKGFIPHIIISEVSDIADEEREKFLKRIEGHDIAPTVKKQIEHLDIIHEEVPIHNSEFVMPLIEILSSGKSKSRMPRSLILAPTRELAMQVSEEFNLLKALTLMNFCYNLNVHMR